MVSQRLRLQGIDSKVQKGRKKEKGKSCNVKQAKIPDSASSLVWQTTNGFVTPRVQSLRSDHGSCHRDVTTRIRLVITASRLVQPLVEPGDTLSGRLCQPRGDLGFLGRRGDAVVIVLGVFRAKRKQRSRLVCPAR
jgi:hypothetical protein